MSDSEGREVPDTVWDELENILSPVSSVVVSLNSFSLGDGDDWIASDDEVAGLVVNAAGSGFEQSQNNHPPLPPLDMEPPSCFFTTDGEIVVSAYVSTLIDLELVGQAAGTSVEEDVAPIGSVNAANDDNSISAADLESDSDELSVVSLHGFTSASDNSSFSAASPSASDCALSPDVSSSSDHSSSSVTSFTSSDSSDADDNLVPPNSPESVSSGILSDHDGVSKKTEFLIP